MRKKFPDINYRTDMSDGDIDKEAKFTVLTRTKMPSVLVENGFFDNYQDAVWLTENYRSIARVQADAIERYFAEITKKELEDNMK
jgi:N-acetylmuramoyl-L-alanine amidase